MVLVLLLAVPLFVRSLYALLSQRKIHFFEQAFLFGKCEKYCVVWKKIKNLVGQFTLASIKKLILALKQIFQQKMLAKVKILKPSNKQQTPYLGYFDQYAPIKQLLSEKNDNNAFEFKEYDRMKTDESDDEEDNEADQHKNSLLTANKNDVTLVTGTTKHVMLSATKSKDHKKSTLARAVKYAMGVYDESTKQLTMVPIDSILSFNVQTRRDQLRAMQHLQQIQQMNKESLDRVSEKATEILKQVKRKNNKGNVEGLGKTLKPKPAHNNEIESSIRPLLPPHDAKTANVSLVYPRCMLLLLLHLLNTNPWILFLFFKKKSRTIHHG